MPSRMRCKTSAVRGERGVTVLFFAISITAMLAVAALVLGGSNGYGAARNAQTAADAASMAATTKLRQAIVADADPNLTPDYAAVAATAQQVAVDNGADPASVECHVVTPYYAAATTDAAREAEVIGTCDGVNELNAAAGGIRVSVRETRDVPFGSFVKSDSITASARATSTVQALGGWFHSPFMVCTGGLHGVNPVRPVEPATTPPTWEVNPNAVGVEFLLWSHGNAFQSRNCGESQWYGLVQDDGMFLIPSPSDPEKWWKIEPGGEVGQIPDLAGKVDCAAEEESQLGNLVGCQIPVPLCTETSPSHSGQNARLNCVAIGTFLITYFGNGNADGACVTGEATGNKEVLCGRLLPDGGLATGGQGQLGPARPHELAVIKLVE